MVIESLYRVCTEYLCVKWNCKFYEIDMDLRHKAVGNEIIICQWPTKDHPVVYIGISDVTIVYPRYVHNLILSSIMRVSSKR